MPAGVRIDLAEFLRNSLATPKVLTMMKGRSSQSFGPPNPSVEVNCSGWD